MSSQLIDIVVQIYCLAVLESSRLVCRSLVSTGGAYYRTRSFIADCHLSFIWVEIRQSQFTPHFVADYLPNFDKYSPLLATPIMTPSAVSMKGLVAIEEAVQIPELAHEAKNHAPGKAADRLAKNLVDIHEQRLTAMDEYGVEMQVSPLAAPHLMLGIITDLTGTSGIIRSRCCRSSCSKKVLLRQRV